MIEQDFLSVIRETEERAEVMVADAQSEARQRIEDARKEAEQRIADAREAAEALAAKTLEQARSLAGGKAKEGVSETTEKAVVIREAAAPAFENAVRVVAERIVK